MNTDKRAPLPFPPYLDGTEARIIARLIDAALRRGLAVRVHDGEEWAGPLTRDRIAVAREVGHTGLTALVLYTETAHGPADRTTLGWVRAGQIDLIHGNGEDVLADHTDNTIVGAVVQEAGQ